MGHLSVCSDNNVLFAINSADADVFAVTAECFWARAATDADISPTGVSERVLHDIQQMSA